MERQQLIKLIDNKGTSSKEETAELWDIVRTFPYFQTARLLLAKSFHNQGSIHFHSELKVASAYAGDRKVLFHLINDEITKQPATAQDNVFVLEQTPVADETPALKLSEPLPDNAFVIPEEHKKYTAPSAFIESKPETIIPKAAAKIEEKKITPAPSTSSFEEPSSNEEIIRRRLSEILNKNKPEEAPPSPQKEENNSEDASVLLPPLGGGGASLDELPAEPIDEIEGLEIETIIEENYLQELERLPEITVPIPHGEENVSDEVSEPLPSLEGREAFSFIDWLKQKNQKETTFEELIDEPAHFHHEKEKQMEKSHSQSSELINKFIADKPRIAPVKVEFYSPANMARQSITDNEDIISETLARIYFEQGNYPKARSYYGKLTLLYPEKSAFFAPLIEKIDTLLKENL